MEDRSHALIAVIFLVVFGVGAAAISLWMISPGAARVPYLLESQINVGGLGPGSPVEYKGVTVGKVGYVRLDVNHPRNVLVLIKVDKNFPLTENSYAVLGSDGLIGNKNIELHLGKPASLLHSSVKKPARLNLQAGKFSNLMAQAGHIISSANSTLKAVHSLLSANNRKLIHKVLVRIDDATTRLARLERKLGPAVDKTPRLLDNIGVTLKRTRKLVDNANSMISKAQPAVHELSRAASSAAGIGNQLEQQAMPQFTDLLHHLRILSEQLDELVKQLRHEPQSIVFGRSPRSVGPGESVSHGQKK